MTAPGPTLSVVVVASNGARTLQGCLESLRPRGAGDQTEIIVISRLRAQSPERQQLEAQFPESRWVEVSADATVPRMRLEGLRESRAEVVALLEDDCVAAPDWCASVMRAHRGSEAAVGGVVDPSAYTAALDWALYLSEYVRFMRPVSRAASAVLPGTNVSYKRAALRDILAGVDTAGDGAAPGFYEVFVHSRLLQAGYALKIDPDVVVTNVNSWRAAGALRSRFHHGRGFAAMRVDRSSAVRRVYFLAVAVLLPAVQVARIAKQLLARRRHLDKLILALPWLILLSMSWSAGEFLGYLLGPGDSLRRWR